MYKSRLLPCLLLCGIVMCINILSINAQRSIYKEDIGMKVQTKGKLVSAHKLIMIIEVDVPKGWKVKVVEGYESMYRDGVDTVDMALKFKKEGSYQLVERLKADRKPSEKGYYYEDITFAQTIRIDSSQLPINVDAELRVEAIRLDEQDFAKANNCCLLQVCKKRDKRKTLYVGWNCNRRERVYLEDLDK